MRASEILFVGSGFRLFFYLLGAKAAFHRATVSRKAGRRDRMFKCRSGPLLPSQSNQRLDNRLAIRAVPFGRPLQHGQFAPLRIKQQCRWQTDGHCFRA